VQSSCKTIIPPEREEYAGAAIRKSHLEKTIFIFKRIFENFDVGEQSGS
jgi:hypothetical protein